MTARNGFGVWGVSEGVMTTPPESLREAEPPPDNVEHLFRTHHGPMVRLAFVLTGVGSIADEVVQEAFLKTHANWSRLDNPGGFLRTAVVNGCRSYHRHHAVETRPHLSLGSESTVEYDTELDDALMKLPYRKRAAIALRYYCDLPEAEIAAALDVRPATVRSLIHRALADLRKDITP
jgi:RNA polymerase sigma factor (sigma-70 family)